MLNNQWWNTVHFLLQCCSQAQFWRSLIFCYLFISLHYINMIHLVTSHFADSRYLIYRLLIVMCYTSDIIVGRTLWDTDNLEILNIGRGLSVYPWCQQLHSESFCPFEMLLHFPYFHIRSVYVSFCSFRPILSFHFSSGPLLDWPLKLRAVFKVLCIEVNNTVNTQWEISKRLVKEIAQ